MITIHINKEHWEDHPFTVDSTITIDEDATSYQALLAFIQALRLETYGDEAIRAALVEAAAELQEWITASHTVMTDRLDSQ